MTGPDAVVRLPRRILPLASVPFARSLLGGEEALAQAPGSRAVIALLRLAKRAFRMVAAW